ncbi:MAG: putative toxin-antitoxin system toxin component, PIN family [Syntrophus sp. (in: bacteria)]|nr:putative toxin-antitoxin system toxin component, PIN family [Syntrophus sp. (in: bacteria)]
MVKAVFDTNVLVAAFLTEGICAKLLIRARRRDFDLILCDGILQEFKRVLKKKFATSPHETSEALIILSEAALEIHGRTDSITPICRDSDDDLILACARDAVADYVVTGDEDLLVLKNYEGINIVNPREFEKLFPD